jgi:hypothetical protein
MGRKSAQVLPSLASFSHILFYRIWKYAHQPKVPWYRWARLACIPTLKGYLDWPRIHSTSPKTCTYFPFLKNVWTPAATACQRLPKFSRPERSAGPTNTKRKDNRRQLCLDFAKKKHFHSSVSFLLTQKHKNNGINYHRYYSRALSGGSWITEGRTFDASQSEVGHARI